MDDLRELLLAVGVAPADVDRAYDDGTLMALLADRFLLPGPRRYKFDAAASAAGMSPEDARRLWRALGFPQPAAKAAAFSDNDVDVIRLLLRNSGALSDDLLQEARIISASLRRVADVLVDEIWRYYRGDTGTDTEAATAVAGQIDIDRVERLLLHLLRRQLVASVYNRSALTTSGSTLAAGFVDLVGFTALSQQLDVGDLGRLVERFEATCIDVIADGDARFVKALGDGVLFTAPTPHAAADVALDLVDTLRAQIGPARGAIACGPVLVRDGDVYGPVVNLASRLVQLAQPNEILAPADTGLAGSVPRRQHVRDIGDVAVITLQRSIP